MPYTLPYGQETRTITLPLSAPCSIVRYHGAEQVKDSATDEAIIQEALSHPVKSQPLRSLARDRHRVAVIISDGTRLVPSDKILPHVLAELAHAGIDNQAVTIVVALGMHRKHTDTELTSLVGEEVYRQYRVINHSPLPDDCVMLGTTSFGTPVELLREVVEADMRIAIGNIEPHGLVGVSGGVKALLPGVASQRAIEAHHALSQRYPPRPGELEHPLRRDLEEVITFVQLHFIVNVVVDHRGHLLSAHTGDPIAAHRQGAAAAQRAFMIGSQEKHAIVIASTGGYPKDIQLYQAVKTLQNAAEICTEGGDIVLLARCHELFGNGIFQYWVETIQDRQRIVDMLNRRFVLGAHKIPYIDDILQQHRVHMYTDMPSAMVTLVGFEPVHDLQATVDRLCEARPGAAVAIMPYGGLTFPYDS